MDWFLPAYKAGGPIQSINNLINNFKEGITYKIFCSNADVDGTLFKTPYNEWIQYNDHTEVWYASKEKRLVKVLKHEIDRYKPDILFINGIYSWYFSLVPLLFCKAQKKIISVRGMLHPGALAQKPFKKKWYLLFWKFTGLHHRYEFHASDEIEKIHIQHAFGEKMKIHIAKNFPKRVPAQQPIKKYKGSLQIISIALISPMKNILSVLHALQNIAENIVYNIYGSVKDETYWKICLQEMDSMPVNIIVRYHGNIKPSKVEEALSQSHVFILPSKSENFGHAIFESLSAGRPVITSYNTPWKLLQTAKAGINVNAESTASLVNAITVFLNMEQTEYDLWSSNAASYATRAIHFEDIKSQYKKMFIAQ